jgi:hypothetical protein
VCRFDACASFKPRFSHGERARRLRNQLDNDGVHKRSDVQCPQKRAAARHCPAQQHPAAPKQVREQDGFHENRCCKSGQLSFFARERRRGLLTPQARNPLLQNCLAAWLKFSEGNSHPRVRLGVGHLAECGNTCAVMRNSQRNLRAFREWT